MNGAAERVKLFLQYIEARQTKLTGGEVHRFETDGLHRFGICLDADLAAALEPAKDQRAEIASGEMFYVPAGKAFSLRNRSSSNAQVLLISLRCLDEFGQSATFAEADHAPGIFKMPQMKNWASDFAADERAGSLSDDWQLQSRLYAIAGAYLKSLPKPPLNKAEFSGFIEQAKLTMLENYDLALDMEQLARSSGAGPSQFYRAFRERTGLSPLKFLISTRLNASLRLLADPGVSVTEAAHSVGYSDEYYFSRLFKKYMGLAPTEYASKAQISVAVLCPVFAGDLSVLGMTPRATLPRDWDLDAENKNRYIREVEEARPDLMLTGPISDGLRKELSRIAPVSMFHWHQYSWKKRLLDFARLLELASVAERWLADFERKTDNARHHVRSAYPDTPFLLVGIREHNIRMYGTKIRKLTDLFYDELRFMAPAAADSVGFVDCPTLHEAAALDCDNAIFLIELPASDEYCKQVELEWKRLKKNRRKKTCLFIRLGEPFLYNAAMHQMLVDQIVNLVHPDNRLKMKSP